MCIKGRAFALGIRYLPTMRPVRAKALIINAFALAGRLAFINPYTQGGCPGLCAYWAFSPSLTTLLVLPDSNICKYNSEQLLMKKV